MKNLTAVQQAFVWAALLPAGAAVGNGLGSGDWRDAFLYAAAFVPVTFLVMWAVLHHKQRR